MKHHTINRHNVPRETLDRVETVIDNYRDSLELYVDRLLWWNERLNLVSRNVSRETIWNHIRHSLLVNSLKCFEKSSLVVDAGTGGGLPGIPLAVTNPTKQFVLDDIVSKKILAVKQMARKLNLKNVRVDDIPVKNLRIGDPCLLISKHTFKINELWPMLQGQPWTQIVLYKGIEFEDELEGLEEALTIDCHDLSNLASFYKGKALIIINRN